MLARPEYPLGPRSEELLSWLQGRAPVGDPVEMNGKEIMPDLGIKYREKISRLTKPLIERGYIERLYVGTKGPKTTVRVLRRLEDEAHKAASAVMENAA